MGLQFLRPQLTRKQIHVRMWRAERDSIRPSSSLPCGSAEQTNLSFIYLIFWFYCINIYFCKYKVILPNNESIRKLRLEGGA